jgi:hypothetical protein
MLLNLNHIQVLLNAFAPTPNTASAVNGAPGALSTVK